MPSIFQSLNIARRAIWANQMGLDVASHNIANVNTPGYSRQRVNMEAALPMQIVQGQLGTGVDANSVQRIRSQLLDVQFRMTNHSLGQSQVQENLLYQLETVIQEPAENSLGNLISDFFSEFSNLGSEPENTTNRNVLIQKSSALADAFQNKYQRLTEMQKSLRSDIQSNVDQINELSRSIADLNRKIVIGESAGGQANDLRDQRDLLMDKLSELVDIRYSEDSRGNMTISAQGQALVSDSQFRELSVETSSDTKIVTVSIKGSTNLSLNIQSGKLGGLVTTHNQKIPRVIDNLNKMAENLIEEVNRIHQSGVGLPTGDPPVSATGLNFFSGTDAASINVAAEVSENAANIAASLDGSPGNGDVAFAIANLRNKKMFGTRTQTLDEYYNSMVADLGTDIQVARNNRQNQDLLKTQIQNQREAESGVSLDEEMTNLIKHQRSLEAAARVIGVVDDILQTVINMV